MEDSLGSELIPKILRLSFVASSARGRWIGAVDYGAIFHFRFDHVGDGGGEDPMAFPAENFFRF